MCYGNKKPVNLQLPILHAFEVTFTAVKPRGSGIYRLCLSRKDGHNLFFISVSSIKCQNITQIDVKVHVKLHYYLMKAINLSPQIASHRNINKKK